MSRRWPGGVLLVLALIAVVAGHGLVRTPTGGTAEAMEIGGPPHVGECVLWAPDPAVVVTDFVVGEADPPTIDLSGASDNVAFGPCSGVVAGEVTTVTPGHPSVLDGSVGALMGTSGRCWAAAARYVGLSGPDVDGTRHDAAGAVDWQPAFSVRGQLIGPDLLQQAAGRRWFACIVRPESLGVYLGSVHNALENGSAPAAFGDCSSNPDLADLSSVSCSYPHTTQTLGMAPVPAGTDSPDAFAASCRAYASRMLRTNDPTYAGALHLVVGVGESVSCAAVLNGPGRLVGSLIGLGTRPLPLIT